MLWRDFTPFVAPYVIGCPLPVLEHHARIMARDWCRNTLALQDELDPVLTDGAGAEVLITPPEGLHVVKTMAVMVGDRERTLVHYRNGQQYDRTQHPGEYCYTRDNATLVVRPVEAAGVPVVITAAMMPSFDAAGLADVVANAYAEDIAKGITASIKLVPNQDFSDPQTAMVFLLQYESRRSTIAAKIARGMSSAKTQSPTHFV